MLASMHLNRLFQALKIFFHWQRKGFHTNIKSNLFAIIMCINNSDVFTVALRVFLRSHLKAREMAQKERHFEGSLTA